jgi:hypothetical protein
VVGDPFQHGLQTFRSILHGLLSPPSGDALQGQNHPAQRQRQGDHHCAKHNQHLPIEAKLFLSLSLQC